MFTNTDEMKMNARYRMYHFHRQFSFDETVNADIRTSLNDSRIAFSLASGASIDNIDPSNGVNWGKKV